MLVYVCDLVTCEVQYAIIKIDTVAVDTQYIDCTLYVTKVATVLLVEEKHFLQRSMN